MRITSLQTPASCTAELYLGNFTVEQGLTEEQEDLILLLTQVAQLHFFKLMSLRQGDTIKKKRVS